MITEIDGHKMEAAGDVIDYVSTRAIGSRVRSAWCATASRRRSRSIWASCRPPTARAGAPTHKLGLALQTLTPELAQSMGIERETRGAVVAEVAPGGAAAAAGVREGDVILEVDRQRDHDRRGGRRRRSPRPQTGGHLVRIRGASGHPLHHAGRAD